MSRFFAPLLTGFFMFAIAVPASAADGPAGTWKTSFSVPTRQGEITLNLLFMFSESEGKWVADFLDIAPQVGVEPTMDVSVEGEAGKFTLKIGPNSFTFV